jgi:hypothetical protein
MDFKQLKSSIKEIAEVASSVPEQFRDRCFDALLNALLSTEKEPSLERRGEGHLERTDEKPKPSASQTVALNSQLRVLLRKTGATEGELNNLVLVENGEVSFIHEPRPKSIREGQLEWSLLIALKNAILRNALEADPEEIRSKCIDTGFYDKANFAANFKSPKLKKLFKGALTNQGKAVALTTEGQDALGELIKRLAGEPR